MNQDVGSRRWEIWGSQFFGLAPIFSRIVEKESRPQFCIRDFSESLRKNEGHNSTLETFLRLIPRDNCSSFSCLSACACHAKTKFKFFASKWHILLLYVDPSVLLGVKVYINKTRRNTNLCIVDYTKCRSTLLIVRIFFCLCNPSFFLLFIVDQILQETSVVQHRCSVLQLSWHH